ncbi:S8 family serine peptidase [Streptomyces caniscabiei]|nr:S8 family serine peptidase [Streptomyces caniscabiei]MDX3716579.1 S8 family serine peptidase [Streptomyces caniscabiei]WEO22468.1 S8 family serine peptidase [Streptomyces caniscabiei]
MALLLACPLALTTAAPAPAVMDADSGRNEGTYRTGTYLVKLADEPLATYGGGLRGLKGTASTAGKRLDVGSGAAKSYLRYLERRRDAVVGAVPGIKEQYAYAYTFNGFAAELTGGQAEKLAAVPGVVSLTRSTVLRTAVAGRDAVPSDARPAATVRPGGEAVAATNSASGPSGTGHASSTAPLPDIPAQLGLSGKKGLWAKVGGPRRAGEGMIIGVIDSGFDPDHPMFAPLSEPRPDADVIARKWHGTCDRGDASRPEFRITCNNKVIGARWFPEGRSDDEVDAPSPLDTDGHGTGVGSIAAGDHATPASIQGTSIGGPLSGVAPAARLAFYKACWGGGCLATALTAAFDSAVADGVDVINFSYRGSLLDPFTLEAMRNAAAAGVFIAGAAGNNGPQAVDHTAPWITSVASTTHDAEYRATLKMGDGRSFTNLSYSRDIPKTFLVQAADVGRTDPAKATLCLDGSLDPAKARGKIVVCDRGENFLDEKVTEVARAGGSAVVIVDTPSSGRGVIAERYELPYMQLNEKDGRKVKAYAATRGATAALTGSTRVPRQAPAVRIDSSSGPDPFSGGDLLKPEIAAPGDFVPAATLSDTPGQPGGYDLISGTSFAAPYVAGMAVLLKSLHPDWSPSEIRSALMTTATTTDNRGGPLGRQDADSASPLDYGAGVPRAARADDPGLVYDSTPADWKSYLCALGQGPITDQGNACATRRRTDPSNLNHPALAVGDLVARQTVTRTVTNVSARTADYKATLKTPAGFKAKVSPKRLTLKPGRTATYKVTFTRGDAPYGTWSFGSLTWGDTHSRHRVTSPLALRAAPFRALHEITANAGGSGSAALTAYADRAGDLTATTKGLYAGKKTTGTLTGTNPDVDFISRPRPSDAVAKVRIQVPKGAAFTRVAVTSANHLPGSDLDMYVFDADGEPFGRFPGTGSDEQNDLPSGTYDVYIVQYALPPGATRQSYTLWTWRVGQGAPDARAQVTPATRPVSPGKGAEFTVAWRGTVPGKRYMGAVEYGDGSTTAGRTILTLTPGP